MYSYYFLASFGSKYRKYLWWKKYLTGFQLVQFATCLAQACVAYRDGCPWPEWMYWWFIGYQFSFLVLFGNFFMVNYVKKNFECKGEPLKNGITENGFSNGIKMTNKMVKIIFESMMVIVVSRKLWIFVVMSTKKVIIVFFIIVIFIFIITNFTL